MYLAGSIILAICLALSCLSCTSNPSSSFPDTASVPMAFKQSGQSPCSKMGSRLAAVVVTNDDNLHGLVSNNFRIKHGPSDADGGSAAPISHDGYFLTASHVLNKSSGKNVHVVYSNGGSIMTAPAKIVWRSASSDLALIHIPRSTPHYYRWSYLGKGLPPKQVVYHGGMHWRDMVGSKHEVHAIINGWICNETISPRGKLRTGIVPDGAVSGTQKFKMDIKLEPGDSGGPVVDPFGDLVGINSAVEVFAPMKTPIFIDSIGVRPNISKIEQIMMKDRNSR
jgi:S1-C subfamily serine protease